MPNESKPLNSLVWMTIRLLVLRLGESAGQNKAGKKVAFLCWKIANWGGEVPLALGALSVHSSGVGKPGSKATLIYH